MDYPLRTLHTQKTLHEPTTLHTQVSNRALNFLTTREAVEIRRSQVPVVNGNTEWHQPPLWQIQNEIYRG